MTVLLRFLLLTVLCAIVISLLYRIFKVYYAYDRKRRRRKRQESIGKFRSLDKEEQEAIVLARQEEAQKKLQSILQEE